MATTANSDKLAARVLQPLLTIADLEAIFRVDRRSIARYCKSGVLPRPLKVGGSNRWRMEDIEEALKTLGAENTEPGTGQ